MLRCPSSLTRLWPLKPWLALLSFSKSICLTIFQIYHELYVEGKENIVRKPANRRSTQ